MLIICSRSTLSVKAVHGSCRGWDSFWAAVNQSRGMWVNAFAQLTADLTNATFTNKLYSLIVSVSVTSCLCINISEDGLVVSCTLPVSASDIQCWVHAESVTMCSIVACHWSTRLIPFRVASSSVRFICRVSFSGLCQQMSSIMDLLSSR